MPQINFKTFKRIIKTIQLFNKDCHKLTKTLLKDTYGFVDFGFNIENEIVELLKLNLNDKDDIIGWWLYEDVKKIIYGKTINYDLTDIKDLYYFLIGELDKVKNYKTKP